MSTSRPLKSFFQQEADVFRHLLEELCAAVRAAPRLFFFEPVTDRLFREECVVFDFFVCVF